MGAEHRDDLEQEASDERFRAVVRSSPMGIHLYRLTDAGELVFVGANPAADAILGVENSQFIGKTIEEAFPPLRETEVPARYRAVASGAAPWRTEQIAYEDNQIAGAFEVHAFKIGDRAMAALFLDITERKRAQQALHDSEDYLRHLVAMAPYAITTTDLAGRIQHCNLQTARLHGYFHPDQLVGHRILELIHPTDRARATADLERMLVEGTLGAVQYRCLRRDGSAFDGVLSATLLRDTADQPRGLVGITRDITEELRQARLIELQRDLAEQLNAITAVGPALELCLATALSSTSLDAGGVYLADRETGDLTLAHTVGLSSAFREAAKLVTADSPRGQLAHQGRPTYIPYEVVALGGVEREGLRALAVLPVLHEGRLIACMNVATHTANDIPTTDRHVLESVAAQLGNAIARLRVTEALRRNEERYRLLVENQTDLVVKADLDGHLTFVSPSYCATFGKSREELLHQPYLPLVHEDDRAATAEALEALKTPPHVAYVEQRALTARGWRWLAWQDTAVLDAAGQVVEVIAVGRDITAQKAAEAALRYRHEFEALALEISTRFINVAPEETERAFEEALTRLCGFTGASGGLLYRLDSGESAVALVLAAGDAAGTERAAPPATPVAHVAPWVETLRAGDAVTITSFGTAAERDACALQELAAVGVHALVDVPLSYGEHLLGFMRLVTREPRAWSDDELALLRLIAQILTGALRRQQSERSLRNLHDQLLQSQKMEAIGRLAGGVAHDFNNILTGITGYAEMAMLGLAEDDPLHDDLAEILAASHRAASLTNQLLAFSRRQVIHPQVLNLNAVVRDSQKMLARIIGEDIELVFKPGRELGAVKTDPAQVDQILVNLATNSRDAMPAGGRLLIETSNVTLDEEYAKLHPDSNPGPYVMLAVSDSGEGMDGETRRRIFEPFFSTKEQGKGTGLGLSTVYGIVRQNGGFIDVYSELGLGTVFKIYFPSTRETATKLAPRRTREDIPGGTEVILLVEDESMVRDLARRILTRQGYRVLDAPGGGDAFLLAEREPGTIDLLLTDVVMPKMNGRELYERLRQLRTGLKVVFMSGYTDDVIAQHGVLEPGMIFVQKPFAADVLLKAVRRALDSAG